MNAHTPRSTFDTRGFSLLEVMVAMTITSIIALAALTTFAQLNRQIVRLQAESLANDDAKTLVDYIISDLQGVGGGAIRPGAALMVENDCGARGEFPDCGGSDRLTLATTISGRPACTIVALTGTTVVGNVAGGVCCLGALVGGDSREQAMLANADMHRQVFLTALQSATCTMTYHAGPASGVDTPANKLDVNGDGSVSATELSTRFVGGSVTALSVVTLFLDPSTRDLSAHINLDSDSESPSTTQFDAGEVVRLARNVFDFQVQLAYDSDPENGRITETLGTEDEWLFNAAGDALGAGGLKNATETNLREAAIGVVVGVRLTDPTYQSSAQIIGGTKKTVPKFHLRSAMGRATLRNIFVFL